jgi:hypothetical protein
MYDYCEAEDRRMTIDPDDCVLCDLEDCQHHPSKKADESKERLERFRSSEFAADVLKRCSTLFAISEADASTRLEAVFKNMQTETNGLVNNLVKDAVRSYVTRQLDAQINTLIETAFAEAVQTKLVSITKDGTAIITTIQERAGNAIKKFLDGQAKQDRYSRDVSKELIDKVIDRVLTDKVEAAIEEIKKEAIDKFNKEAMKHMMRGMAKAIGEDKRLLTMMCDGDE